jgi:hypothetical protein
MASSARLWKLVRDPMGGGGGDEAADIDGIDGDVGAVAGVNGGGDFGENFLGHGKAAGEEDEGLAAGDVRKAFGHVAERAQDAADGVIAESAAAAADEAATRGGTDCGEFNAGYDLLKTVGIVGEVLCHAEGAAKFGDGHEAVGAGVLLDEFGGGLAGVGLLGGAGGGVVEEENEVVFAGVFAGGSGFD